MSTAATRTGVEKRQVRKVAAAALTASTLEWYDFYIYGTAAALVFGPHFFSGIGAAAGTLAAMATFGVGFIFRPVGGLLFGHFGDRLGRKRLLVIAMMLMGISTFLIGLLPGYATIGIASPLLLVLLRVLQGVAVGGQYGGAILLVTESAPAHRRGFYGSFAHIGPSLAVIVSNVVFLVVANLVSPAAFASWGWRIPFLLSAIVIAAGLLIQLRVTETADFQRLREEQAAKTSEPEKRRSPLLVALRTHPKEILQAGGMILLVQVYYYILIVFSISYTTSRGTSKSEILILVLLSSAVTVVSIPLFAALSDRIGRKKVIIAATVLSIASVIPFVTLLETLQTVPTLIGLLIPGLALGAMYGPMAAFYSEMFSTGVRYSGASTGYQLGAVVGGGFAPLIASALLEGTGSLWAVGGYIIAAGVLSLLAVATTKDRYRPAR
ncbi:MFS transporter [Amycolatopsis thermoflava]|uniref:Sugar transport protein n=1 Tax=Amycolatopsis thermoflava TaxID=84480 RepID=A0A3N2G682_9PSEU|nr:MFS transporter [Amycolatopsis thermoflava]ROS32151.1 sugar transport protein [Amycolatopsis thermoflava]